MTHCCRNAVALAIRFQPGSFLVARSPTEYQNQFTRILSDPIEAEKRDLQAQREVFASHTVFQRVEGFVNALLAGDPQRPARSKAVQFN